MEIVTIRSFAELHDFAGQPRLRNAIFRGVRDSAHDALVPAVGRGRRRKMHSFRAAKYERDLLRAFKRLAFPHLAVDPRNDWEWLCIGRHHGLATRLLDWSHNVLVATFFAVEDDFDQESAIFACVDLPAAREDESPFGITEVVKFSPSHVTPRVVAQKGIFTVHPEPFLPFVPANLIKAVFPVESRYRLKNDLYRYGICYAALFPDLDGLAAELNWRYGNPLSGSAAERIREEESLGDNLEMADGGGPTQR
jgi:hypothetical protein